MSTEEFLENLENEFPGLKAPRYKFRKLFDSENKIFFDAEASDQPVSLQQILDKPDQKGFTVFVLIREKNGNLRILDVGFTNLGTETLSRFIGRFMAQLEPVMKMGIIAENSEYIRVLGFSYKNEMIQ